MAKNAVERKTESDSGGLSLMRSTRRQQEGSEQLKRARREREEKPQTRDGCYKTS